VVSEEKERKRRKTMGKTGKIIKREGEAEKKIERQLAKKREKRGGREKT
jgi:hypothetical protein